MRYPSIDILRTVAIFVMVLVHFGENLSNYSPPITGFGAPVFAFLSGISYVLWVQGQQRKGRSESDISKISVRRGLFVFGVGFAFNLFVWLPEDTFNWDVLTFIGAALLLLNGARHVPRPILVLMAVVSVFVSPVLRVMADYDAYWVEGYYEGDLTLSDVLIGFLATGYFPIFPWIAYSLAGFVTATVVFGPLADSRRLSKRTALVGCLLIAVSMATLFVHLWPLWIYGVAKGQEPTYYLGKVMSPLISLPLALVFMAACLIWFRWMGSGERRGIESWMRWLCD